MSFDPVGRLAFQPFREIAVAGVLSVLDDGVRVVVLKGGDEQINILIWNLNGHDVGSRPYRFFPAFFILPAYATFARSDAARRMAGVHRARFRTV